MKFKPQYSGKNSKKFWKEINSFNHYDYKTKDFLYTLGCILQETEGRILTELNNRLLFRKKSL